MELLFWITLLLIIYCYFGYPLLITLLAKVFERKVRKEKWEPSVSIIISAWNEEDVIERKLKNFLGLDYPKDKMEIIIGSDGSTDDTNKIINSFDDSRINLVESVSRAGKITTINCLVGKAQNEFLVLTDARQEFKSDAIRQLVANFSDPKVGCVSGELIFSQKDEATAKGINLYWNYEKFMRKQESKLHSMLGATGAIYAVRRELYTPIPQDIVLDDVYVPFKVIQKGYRAIFDESAKAYDEVADSPKEEYKRKARTLYGNYQIFRIFKGMFMPFKSPIAIQFFSHKFLRVIVPFFMILLIIVNALLMKNAFFLVILFLQLVFYAMACVGALARHQKYGMLKILAKLCYVPYVFCLLNFSALVGFLRYAGSKQEVTWEKARS